MTVENTTINERIYKIREHYCNGDNSNFARILNKSTTTTSSICSGKATVSQKIQEDILKCFPEVSRVWLLAGVGEMISNAPAITQNNVNGQNINGNRIELGSQTDHTDIDKLLSIIDFMQRQIEQKDEAMNTIIASMSATIQDISTKLNSLIK